MDTGFHIEIIPWSLLSPYIGFRSFGLAAGEVPQDHPCLILFGFHTLRARQARLGVLTATKRGYSISRKYT